MRKLSFIAIPLFLALSCKSEKDLEPADTLTFTRYFTDGYADEPVSIEEIIEGDASSGFIILANTNIKNSDADPERDRIMLIKTDQFGHQEWVKYYPSRTNASSTKRWKASSLSILPDGGYLIAGEQIEGENTKMLLVKINMEGDTIRSRIYPTSYFTLNGTNLTGRAAITAPSKTDPTRDNIMALGFTPNNSSDRNILITEIDFTSLDTLWSRTHSGGNVTLTNKLFYTSGATPYLQWAGEEAISSTRTSIFITQTKLDAESTENGQSPIGNPTDQTHGLDLCRKGEGFGYVGYLQNSGELGDMFFCSVSATGNASDFTVYDLDIFDDPSKLDPAFNVKAEKANSITSTRDGGYMILGTIDTYTGVLGQGNTDILMLKINGFGDKQWSKAYGSPDVDNAVCVRQTSDGGYVVLGVTRLAALRSILLVKTDKNGQIE